MPSRAEPASSCFFCGSQPSVSIRKSPAGSVYVAYAKQDDEGEEEVKGPGLGVIDKYDLNGRLLARVATGGSLNAPWGMALAPGGTVTKAM